MGVVDSEEPHAEEWKCGSDTGRESLRSFAAAWRLVRPGTTNQCGWWSTRWSELSWSGAGCQRLPGRGLRPGDFVGWVPGP
jgi:hypothetical protein